ncbi:MAG: molybdopterin-dependent oxidoreductase, partial [Candidatus Subteraquimicrobiales bacterium]|nr:molybdopterin-dependent oxidoreductase [Candidatus Subteraquimicrobiales bacterium]
MTQQWTDVKNAKAILICGGNPAENHPVAFKHITKAMEENDATLICVDPRFTRSASKAKIYAPIRPGADLVFFGALINYMIEKKHYDENYVKWHTNALWKVNPAFSFDPKTGLFSGYSAEKKKYDQATWTYKLGEDKKVEKATDLSDPDCAFQKLKNHYSRYTADMVEKVCGMPKAKFEEIAEVLGTQKPSVLYYAMGLTQHTVGSMMIACYAILQLLLGNLGKPGSGINACRGEPNVQGSTDMGLLTHILPGYLGAPLATNSDLTAWTKAQGTFRKKFLINLLKAWYGDAATAENDWAYSYLPKRNPAKNTTHVGAITAMADGKIKGAICMGMNLMVGTPNTNLVRRALANLEWLVSANLFTEETACFWRDPEVNSADIQTEVFFLPPAGPYEKEGTFVDSARVLQWKYKAVEPPGDAKADLDILDMLAHELKSLYKGSKDAKDKPIQDLTWSYGEPPEPEKVLTEMNGYDLKTGKPVAGIGKLMGDGTTSTGCWIYSGIMGGDPAKGENVNRSKNCNPDDPSGYGLYSGWGYAWPGNVRIIYNRSSCDLAGNPINSAKKLVWWNAEKVNPATGKAGMWDGFDKPDVPAVDADPATPAGKRPFRLLGDGVGKLFMAKYAQPQPDPKPDEDPAITKAREAELPVLTSAPLVDGPFTEHYEPVETPLESNPLNGSLTNPAMAERGEYCPLATSIEEYPHILSTY